MKLKLKEEILIKFLKKIISSQQEFKNKSQINKTKVLNIRIICIMIR